MTALAILLGQAKGRPAVLVPHVWDEILRDHAEEIVSTIAERDDEIDRLTDELADAPNQQDVDHADERARDAEAREAEVQTKLDDAEDRIRDLEAELRDLKAAAAAPGAA